MVRLSQELRPKVQVSYCYSLNTRRSVLLSKLGYAKVDGDLPRKVVLVVDGIVHGSQCNGTRIRGTRVRSYRARITEITM